MGSIPFARTKREPSLVLFFRTGECPPFHVTLLLNPPPREEDLPSAVAENRVVEGKLRFLTPRQLSLTAPVRGIPSSTTFQTGVPAAAMFYKHLADADAAALMRLGKIFINL